MFHYMPRALGLVVIVVIGLGACAPATGTPEIIGATQAATNVPAATAAPSQAVAVNTPPTTTTLSIKSKDPSTLTYLCVCDPSTLDPALDYDSGGGQILQNTYDTLIFYNKADPNSFIPQLAVDVPSQANGGISADGKTYTFRIRTGVKFHNGDVLTPDDAAFTFQRGLLQGGVANSPQWLLFQPILGATAGPNNDIADLVDPTGSIAASGDYTALQKADTANLLGACQRVTSAIVANNAAGTLTFHLAQSWGPFLSVLANSWGSISDRAWIAANGGWDGDCHTWQKFYAPTLTDQNKSKLGSGENGTGPYMLDHWIPTREVVLKANPNYWRTESAWPGGPTGAPRLKTIVLKSDAPQFATRLNTLRAGDADFIDLQSTSDWTLLDPLVGEICDATGACAPAADPSQPIRAFKGLPSVSRSDLFFNFKIDTTSGNDFIGSGKLDGNGIPPDFFSDVHVRKAFNYCFDWDAYIKGQLLSDGVQSYDVMLPGEIGYSDHDPHYSYDPAQCQAQFQASTLKSGGGLSLWDTGFHFTIGYNTGNTYKEATAQILKQDLARVNPKFQVEVLGLPFQTYLDALAAHQLPLNLYGWVEDIHDPNDWLAPYVTGSYAAQQSLPADVVQQLRPFIDQGVDETDPANRAAIYKQFNQAYYAAAPVILLAVQHNRVYEQRWVQGYYYNPIYAGDYFYALSKQ